MTPTNQIFTYWQQVMDKPKARLSPERKAKILTRLKDFTVDEIKQGIDGCRASDWHMGTHKDNKTKYNDIELICRNTKNLEGFIEQAEQPKEVALTRDSQVQKTLDRYTDRSWAEDD